MIYEVKNISFAYPGEKKILDDVSFSFHEGEILTLLGRNGAGKSTLMSCLTGTLTPGCGEIHLNGKNISSLTARKIAGEIGFVPQTTGGAFPFTVLDYIMMGCACDIGLFARPGKKERMAAEAVMEELGLTRLANRPFPCLSGGEQQQCTIARALVRKPKAILMDEPEAHLDVENQLRILRMIRKMAEQGYAVMFTTHNPDHALLLGGNTLLLEGNGHITAGTTEETVTEEKLQQIYGDTLRLRRPEGADRMICYIPGL